jgi:hypothetical protein
VSVIDPAFAAASEKAQEALQIGAFLSGQIGPAF